MNSSPSAPLAGIRVVVTRPAAQAEGLVRAYQEAGATVVRLPLLAVMPPEDPAPLDAAAARLADFSWVALTSANAVRALLPRVEHWPDTTRLAAVGGATAAALEEHGLKAHLVPAQGDAEHLAQELLQHLAPDDQVLLPQAADARPTLEQALRAAQVPVSAVTAYDKRLPPQAAAQAEELFLDSPLGWVTFTSPRIARSFAELLGGAWPSRRNELRAASIGPVTSTALRELGVEPAAEAARPSDDELVAATVAAVSAAGGGGELEASEDSEAPTAGANQSGETRGTV
ncbi:MAG: uroporphyrinogen-III synthase [Acidobacteriota bacterium]|nr:uroporphyrinogen-III synthase [Acidobacteriota bacterium]